ncbi:MAG: response regulator transcription factor [Bacteroidota bacterium]
MSDKKLLIVEDDPNLGQILQEYLEIKGYKADLKTNGEEGIEAFSADRYDLCILDIMMPKKDGFSLAKEIRAVDTHIPIVFLTAKSMKEDTIEGFKIGADDYITKPFSMEELLLRLKAILKRSEGPIGNQEQHIFNFGQFIFNYDQQMLSINGSQQKLTSKESDLLRLLCMNINKALDRNTALKLIWGNDTYFNARSMDVYITKLRKYLKKDETIQILTLHGQGFKLVNVG